MEQTDDQFYISLMSNSNLDEYPDNTLSSFTNKLAKTCRVNDQWVVGITEIFFNSFSRSQQLRMSHDVETFPAVTIQPIQRQKRKHREYVTRHNYQNLELTPSKKQKRSSDFKFIINAHNEYKIILSNTDVKDMCYDKNDLNFGKFLEVLSTKLTPIKKDETKTSVEKAKKEIKRSMMDIIKKTDWSAVEKRDYNAKENTYKLHVYMGSKIASIVMLNSMTYQTIDHFITDVIAQIPIDRRKTDDLLRLFDIYYSKYKLYNNVSHSINDDDDSLLRIEFNEYGISTEINTRELLNDNPSFARDGVSLKEIIKLFKDNLKFNDNTSEQDKIELREKIANSVLDVLRGNKLDSVQIKKRLKENDIPLNVMYEKAGENYKVFKAVLKPGIYNRMDEFLHEIYNQVPRKKRNKDIFVETLYEAFDANADKKKSDIVVYVPPHISNIPAGSPQFTYLGDNIYDVKPQETTTTIATTTTKTVAVTPATATTPVTTTKPVVSVTEVKTNTGQTDTAVNMGQPVVISAFTDNFTTKKNKIKNTQTVSPTFIYVYSDIIKTRFCSSQLVRVLRVIPNVEMNQKRIEFSNVEYCPLERTNFDSISLLLADGQGKKIPFNASKTPTYVQLHFKRV